jgi:hypothetical protein
MALSYHITALFNLLTFFIIFNIRHSNTFNAHSASNLTSQENMSFNTATLSPSSSQWPDNIQQHPIQNQTGATSQNMQISYSNHTVRRTSLVT